MCLKIYELDPVRFFFHPGISMASSIKNTKVKSDLLTNIDMLLMEEKGISGEICDTIH